MKQWSDFVPQARQVVEGVRATRRVRQMVFEGDPTRDTEIAWAEMALSILSSLVTEAVAVRGDYASPPYEEDYYLNCAFLLDCGFHIEMPQWLGMCGEYAWGSN